MTLAGEIQVVFVNVGQGDCTIIADVSSRTAMIIDCPSKHVDKVNSYLAAHHLRLDTLMVTHWDRDHYGGVARLAGMNSPSAVYYNNPTLFTQPNVGARGIRSTLKAFLDLGHDILLPAECPTNGTLGSVSWKFLAPTHAEVTSAVVAQNRNVASSVVDIDMAGTRLLIGGDAVSATWDRLLSSNLGKAQLLRWPHHGAQLHGDRANTISTQLMATVEPEHVVISVGETNSYGHPAPDIVNLVRENCGLACTQVTQNCRQASVGAAHSLCGGSICIEIDGAGYKMSSCDV